MKFREGEVFREFTAGGKKVMFRALKRKDLKGCLNHINTLIREKAYIGFEKEGTLEEERKWLRNELKENREGKRVTVVAEMQGKIIGIGTVWKGVLPAHYHKADLGIGLNSERRKGIGYRLMMMLERLAAERLKCGVISFSVYEKNAAARSLYEKCGYSVAGRIPCGCRLRGKYYDELIMVKDIG